MRIAVTVSPRFGDVDSSDCLRYSIGPKQTRSSGGGDGRGDDAGAEARRADDDGGGRARAAPAAAAQREGGGGGAAAPAQHPLAEGGERARVADAHPDD